MRGFDLFTPFPLLEKLATKNGAFWRIILLLHCQEPSGKNATETLVLYKGTRTLVQNLGFRAFGPEDNGHATTK